MKDAPSRRQLELLRFIHRYLVTHGKAPSWREMTRAAGAGCPNTATGYVNRFEARGWVTRVPGKRRSLRLTKAGERVAETGGA